MIDRPLKVSAILITYNGAAHIERALACVAAQTRAPDEVIIVDDGSSDDSPDIIARHPEARHFRQENAGPSAARNHGARMATGEVLCFLDIDDFWDKGKLEREVALLEQDESIDIVQGQIIDVESGTGDDGGSEPSLRVLTSPYHFVNIGSLSIRRAAFERIGGYDESRTQNEDTDWFMRAWEAGANKVTVDQPSLYYRISEASLSSGGTATSQSLPALLKQHRDRCASGQAGTPTTSLKDFFIGFPDRSKRQWNGEMVTMSLGTPSPPSPEKPPGRTHDPLAEQQFKLARVWKKRGKWRPALESYRRFIEKCPDHAIAHIEMGAVLEQCGDPAATLEHYEKALASFPNEAELHKGYIKTLEESHGSEEVFRRYDLNQAGPEEPVLPEDALVCIFVCRNENQRLPYFLQYYRDLGVTHFFAIDNGSDDGTTAFLASQKDLHLWTSSLSFNRANFGSAWFEVLLRSYATGRWCLTVDVDELLYYPDSETLTLRDLCASLEERGERVLSTVLLDVYSKGPVAEAVYERGTPFLNTCSFFDREFHHSRFDRCGPFENMTYFFGGLRERVFGANDSFLQTKVSLIRYDTDTILAGGQHWTNLPRAQISAMRGCLLHFKYFSDFAAKISQEVARKEHYQGALQYRQYLEKMSGDPQGITLHDPEHSEELKSSEQLVELGIMTRGEDSPGGQDSDRFVIPQITTLKASVDRPKWSVMVTVYDRVTHLERCLKSILCQAAPADTMHIEVIADPFSDEITRQIRTMVDRLGGGRVLFQQDEERRGHPHIFNRCIERATGEWVHIVHDDDWLEPGFYEAMEAGIASRPDVGAAFCRYLLKGSEGEVKWTSDLERETPGILDDWTERIGIYCRLAFSSMVVKRQAYEEVGGFSPSIGSAFDWDMWKRVALKFPVWYEPRPLLNCGREGDSLTDGLMLDGQQMSDSLLSIDRTMGYWPEASKQRIADAAREHYAHYALDLGKKQIAEGLHESALKNLSWGLKASRSMAIQSKLVRLLASL